MNEQNMHWHKRDIRWVQRFDNYCKAFDALTRGVELASQRPLSRAEKLGIIHCFVVTYEVAWKVLMDFFASVGEREIYCGQDAFAISHRRGLIDATAFFEMGDSLRDTLQAYDSEVAEDIFTKIIAVYYAEFEQLKVKMSAEKERRGL